ncbi:class I fructose-bisphosphate aldolase [Herbaspirillum sp. ST 5-3]|uniref:class I fructose-bisphosphate aldolase n=1 Tax=Oxalobacteraceae TaxID=75682 RepID=UPI0010A4E1DC|nr:class I fructose-bisphosphate aldolase [Herbaspirillum sp. ST 5-3]
MNIDELNKVARAIVADRKGILAADESGPTIKKRFDAIQLASSEESRRRYRDILFTTEDVEQYLGGVILYEETLRQSSKDGIPFAELLSRRGIIPGIKVDKGSKALALHPGEKITEGLDGLRERLVEYRQMGARFAKWRAVIEIDEHTIPSGCGIRTNMHALARYAALCQEEGIVPIVEPEVLMDGAHGIARCEEVSSRVLGKLFRELDAHGVAFEGLLLKPNMIIPGMKCPQQASVQQVAEATVRCLKRYVPAAVPGIVFLSGGQSAEDATDHLNAMNNMGPHPWQLSFSYGRALQAPVLAAWQGQESRVEKAQQAFLLRCRLNGLARAGAYAREMEKEAG